jgi:hypothetical protein
VFRLLCEFVGGLIVSRGATTTLTRIVAPRVKCGKNVLDGPTCRLRTVPVTGGSGATVQSFSSSPPWEYETNTGKACAVTVHPRLAKHAFQGGICYRVARRRPQNSRRRPTAARVLALLSASLPRRDRQAEASGCPVWRGCPQPPQFLWISAVAGCPDCRCCQIGADQKELSPSHSEAKNVSPDPDV